MKRVRVTYLILAHNNPSVLSRAVRRLSVEDSTFILHIDKKTDIEQFSRLLGDSVRFCEDRVPVYWGEFSLVQAILNMLRAALADGSAPDYCVLLSGSDYPLRTASYIHRYLGSNYGLEFISLTKVPAPGKPLSRIQTLRYPSNRPISRLVTRVLARFGFAQRDYRKYIGDMEPYSGSCWWALTRGACEHIVDFVDSNPQFVRFFQNVFAADEAFFQTILGNSSFRPRIRRNLHFEDWSAQGASPANLNDQHVDFFGTQQEIVIEDIFGRAEALFARKFSDSNLSLLGRVDDMATVKELNNAYSS